MELTRLLLKCAPIHFTLKHGLGNADMETGMIYLTKMYH